MSKQAITKPKMNSNNDESPDSLGGKYLTTQDLTGPTVVTIKEIRLEPVPHLGDQRLVMALAEYVKPMILDKTNTSRLVQIFGSTDRSSWRGRIDLYVENDSEQTAQVNGILRVESLGNTPPCGYLANGNEEGYPYQRPDEWKDVVF